VFLPKFLSLFQSALTPGLSFEFLNVLRDVLEQAIRRIVFCLHKLKCGFHIQPASAIVRQPVARGRRSRRGENEKAQRQRR